MSDNDTAEVWRANRRVAFKSDPTDMTSPTRTIVPGQEFEIPRAARESLEQTFGSPGKNWFRNGALEPVSGADTDEKLMEEREADPNLRSREELHEILTGHWKHFDTWLAGVSDMAVLRRALEMAEAEPEGVTARTITELRDRITEMETPPDEEDSTGPGGNLPDTGASPI
jgi:hypothetical protein